MKPTERTNRALAAMRAYTGNRDWYLGVPDAGTDLTDLLADLMHLYGVDSVDGAYETAAWHFDGETTGGWVVSTFPRTDKESGS